MKTFCTTLLALVSLAYSTPACAERQSFEKPYVDVTKVRVSSEGLFFQTNRNEWMQVRGLPENFSEAQLGGFLDLLFPSRHFIAKCNSCDAEYINRAPQPCDACDREDGMTLIYEQEGYYD
jgi:hypothetical protein